MKDSREQWLTDVLLDMAEKAMADGMEFPLTLHVEGVDGNFMELRVEENELGLSPEWQAPEKGIFPLFPVNLKVSDTYGNSASGVLESKQGKARWG
jgi:hypothetical protein